WRRLPSRSADLQRMPCNSEPMKAPADRMLLCFLSCRLAAEPAHLACGVLRAGHTISHRCTLHSRDEDLRVPESVKACKSFAAGRLPLQHVYKRSRVDALRVEITRPGTPSSGGAVQ